MAKKVKIPDPLSEIAANLVAAVEGHRAFQTQKPDTPFLTWSQLVASQSGVSMDWATASLQKSPAKSSLIVAIADDLKSPVGLQQDQEQLSRDAALLHRLVQHPSSGCSEALPVRDLSDLCKSLDKSLKKSVEGFWTLNPDKLPTGLTAIEKKVGKKTVVSLHDQRFARPEVLLSRKLTTALESLRKAGDMSYPALLAELIDRADVPADEPLLPAAFTQPPFSDAVMVVAGKSPLAWLALRGDAEQVVNSEGFLRRLLLNQCSETFPELKLSALSKLLTKDLQSRFTEVWRTHFDLHHKFGFVEFSAAGSKTKPDLILRDSRFRRPEKVLAELLVKQLENQKNAGAASYPTTWKKLIELTKSTADKSLFSKASAVEPFAGRVILAFPAGTDSPVALLEDAAELAASASLLDSVISLIVTEDHQAVQADKLAGVKGLNPVLKPHLVSAIERSLSSKQMLPGIGAFKAAGKWYICRLKDILSGTSSSASVDEAKSRSKKPTGSNSTAKHPADPKATAETRSASESAPAVSVPASNIPEPVPQPEQSASSESSAQAQGSSDEASLNAVPSGDATDPATLQSVSPGESPVISDNDAAGFKAAFDQTFERLSEISRLPGCVSLADLRPALNQYSRKVFDAELTWLRKAGEYSLSVVEGRYPLSDDERSACLVIENSPHLLVRRRIS